MDGCRNCKYCKCYPGDYWTPDDYECICGDKAFEGMSQDNIDAIYDRVWVDGEEWKSDEDPICPAYEEAPTPEDDYWDKYAWEENHYDKDERI